MKWSTSSIREAYLKAAGKKFLSMDWTMDWFDLQVFSSLLKGGCYCILKLNSLDTPFELHFKVWNGNLPLDLWKLCHLVFLLLSCTDTYPGEVRLHAIDCFHPGCWSIGQNLIESSQTFVISRGATVTDGEIIWPVETTAVGRGAVLHSSL